ncbi:hypothetical protein GT707_28140 [Clostridium beijerinckii]|nr:hypothetical protein [Clostridium beijerinckii]
MKMMILSYNKEINQDNNKWTFEEIAKKHRKESNELAIALLEKDTMHIAEEVFDQLQICIDVLDKLESLGMNIEQMCMRHNKKLVMRKWVNDPSQEQKEAEEIFRLRESLSKANEQNEILADDRKRLKNIVDLALSVIIHISIADNNSIKQIQELKTKAEQAVRASEILDILIS